MSMRFQVISFCCVMLSACDGANNHSLARSPNQNAQQAIKILSIRQAPRLAYTNKDIDRSPFTMLAQRHTAKQTMMAYPLNAFKWVGLMQQDKQRVALLQAPNQQIIMVREGNLLGIEADKVMQILDHKVVVRSRQMQLRFIKQETDSDGTENTNETT